MKSKNKNKPRLKLSEDMSLALSVAVVAVIIIFGGSALGLFGAKEEAPDVDATVSQTAVTTTQPTTAPTTAQPTAQPSAPAVSGQNGTTARPTEGASQENTTLAPSPSGKTTAEIISIFNESANKVKTDAVKVVKNYEKRRHNEEHLIVPKVVEGMANDLLTENFKDDTEPIEYPTREDIVSQYQVPGVEWASQLTEAEVASASINDTGSEYEIAITLHPSTNPEPGVGVAKAFDTITKSEVMEKAPSFVTSFDTNYSDCTVKCRIDKATGRTVWSNYTSTVILSVKLTFLGKPLDAQVGMTFEKDYTITY